MRAGLHMDGGLRRSATLISLLLATVPVVASTAHAGRATVMYKMEPRPHGAVDGVTQEQIRCTVIELAEDMGWAVHQRTQGVVEADISISGGKHRATIAMVFDGESFVIRYVSSFNLGYSDARCPAPVPRESGAGRERTRQFLLADRAKSCSTEVIHPIYNDYVREIEEDIAAAVPRLQPAVASDSPPPVTAVSIDEETHKLQALRAAGILTASEVEAHTRLLGAAPKGAGEAE